MPSTNPIDASNSTTIGITQCTNIGNNTGATGASTNCVNFPVELTNGIAADLALIDNANNVGESLPLNGASRCGGSPLTLVRVLRSIKNAFDYVKCWLCRLETNIANLPTTLPSLFPNNSITSRVVALNNVNFPVPVFSFPCPQAPTVQYTNTFTMQASGSIQVNLYGNFRALATAPGTYGVNITIDGGLSAMEKVITNPSAINGFNTFSSVKTITGLSAGVHTIQLVKSSFGTAGGAVEWAQSIEIIEL